MYKRYTALSLLCVLQLVAAAETVSDKPPRLVVNIVIDQLASDYIDAFSPLFSQSGFKKLMAEGTVFTNVTYPFVNIDRASASASLASGTVPYYHSIIGRRWFDRETLHTSYCVDDSKASGFLTKESLSPRSMKVSTVGDELKVSTAGKARVCAVSPFADAAILSAGHVADGVLWIDDETGRWCTSSFFDPTLSTWLNSYNTLHPLADKLAKLQWQPMDGLTGGISYLVSGATAKPFKYKFDTKDGYRDFKTSALVNEEVTAMAKECLYVYSLGADEIPDLLNITYYAGNYRHSPVAQSAMELQDTYVRLDRELSRLIAEIEKRIGKDAVLFTLTGTGYDEELEADYAKYNIPSGTFYINRTASLVNMYFGAIWGQDRYIDGYFGNQIYLNHKLLEQKRITLTDACRHAAEVVSQCAGVKNVFTGVQLLTGTNPNLYKVRDGYCRERSGDLTIEIQPGWYLNNEDTGQSSLSRASFAAFPLVFYGAGLRPERVTTAVTTSNIAPTIAKAIRIRAPNACSTEPLF